MTEWRDEALAELEQLPTFGDFKAVVAERDRYKTALEAFEEAAGHRDPEVLKHQLAALAEAASQAEAALWQAWCEIEDAPSYDDWVEALLDRAERAQNGRSANDA